MLELVTTGQFHILPDWLLVYSTDKEKLILTASRTGTHSDLFAK